MLLGVDSSTHQVWHKNFTSPLQLRGNNSSGKPWDFSSIFRSSCAQNLDHSTFHFNRMSWTAPDLRHKASAEKKQLGLVFQGANESQFTALISECTNRGQHREALRVYEEMYSKGVKASTHTFLCALKACSSLEDWESGRKIHKHIIDSGKESHMFVATMLVHMYATRGRMVDARSIFDKMPHCDVVTWTAMILGYAKKDEAEMALQLYASMQQKGVLPNERTYLGTLKACTSLATLEGGNEVGGNYIKAQCLEKGRSIHSRLVVDGFSVNAFVANTLLDMYVKCGSMVDAWHMFEMLPHRDAVSWNAMILAYAQKAEGEFALELYVRMLQEGVAPNDRTFVGVLKACCSLRTLGEGTEAGTKFVSSGSLEKGRALHCQAVKRGFESNAFVGTCLVDMYAKCGSIADARHVFDQMLHRNVACWTAMILAYVELGENEEAFALYAQMQEQDFVPNGMTFVSILEACGNTAAFEAGKEIHRRVRGLGLDAADIILANALIDMYGKCGSMADAQQVFDALPTRDLVTWSALIAGYARQGDSDLVFALFERMRHEGIQPNGVTFLSILSVCSHAGLVDQGKAYFNALSQDHCIAPTIQHYSCMVDLLGRAGLMDEAVALVEKMPFQPNLVTWTSLLGACRKWTDVDAGRKAFEHAMKLDKTHAAPYFLMSSIYEDARMWEDRDEIQAMREKARAWKKPGGSWWAENDGMVHSFLVGDSQHPQSKQIYAKLQELSVQMEQGLV